MCVCQTLNPFPIFNMRLFLLESIKTRFLFLFLLLYKCVFFKYFPIFNGLLHFVPDLLIQKASLPYEKETHSFASLHCIWILEFLLIANFILSLLFFQVPPPFKPQVMSDTDTRYFDIEFTDESVELTPPDDAEAPSEFSPISEVDEGTFSQFSYQVFLFALLSD